MRRLLAHGKVRIGTSIRQELMVIMDHLILRLESIESCLVLLKATIVGITTVKMLKILVTILTIRIALIVSLGCII